MCGMQRRVCVLSVLSVLALLALTIYLVCDSFLFCFACMLLSIALNCQFSSLVATAADVESCMIHNYTCGVSSPVYYFLSCSWCLVRATPFSFLSAETSSVVRSLRLQLPGAEGGGCFTHTCLHVSRVLFVVACSLCVVCVGCCWGPASARNTQSLVNGGFVWSRRCVWPMSPHVNKFQYGAVRVTP